MTMDVFGGGESNLMDKFVSVAEAVSFLGIKRVTVYKLIHRSTLKAYKVGDNTSPWMISMESIQSYIDRSVLTDTTFIKLLKSKIDKKDKKLIRLLILRYGKGLSTKEVYTKLKVSSTTYFTWEKQLFNYLKPLWKELSYADIKDDSLALKICARCFLDNTNKKEV